MKIKNITILSILAISMITGCQDKTKIDENSIVTQEQTVNKTIEKTIEKSSVKNSGEDVTQEKKKVEKNLEVIKFNLYTSKQENIEVKADLKNGWKFKGFENKVILLDFFGTWCPPCKAEIAHLNSIRKKLKKDFEIIGLDIGLRNGGLNSVKDIQNFKKDFNMKYPVVLGGDNNNLFRAVSSLNPQGSIPFMLLFDKKGRFVKHYIGMVPEEMLYSDISQVIKMK